MHTCDTNSSKENTEAGKDVGIVPAEKNRFSLILVICVIVSTDFYT